MTEDEAGVIGFCAMLVYFLIDSYIDVLKSREKRDYFERLKKGGGEK